ncbi:MAG: holin [bacterium]|nr:holin [bacterium]
MSKKTKTWIKAAGVRAIKTMAQTFASMITVGVGVADIDWKVALSAAAVAGIYSIITSVAGLPEVQETEESEVA